MYRLILDYENRIFFAKDKSDTSPATEAISTSILFFPAAIVLFTFRMPRCRLKLDTIAIEMV